jgi:hypothetical protein
MYNALLTGLPLHCFQKMNQAKVLPRRSAPFLQQYFTVQGNYASSSLYKFLTLGIAYTLISLQ